MNGFGMFRKGAMLRGWSAIGDTSINALMPSGGGSSLPGMPSGTFVDPLVALRQAQAAAQAAAALKPTGTPGGINATVYGAPGGVAPVTNMSINVPHPAFNASSINAGVYRYGAPATQPTGYDPGSAAWPQPGAYVPQSASSYGVPPASVPAFPTMGVPGVPAGSPVVPLPDPTVCGAGTVLGPDGHTCVPALPSCPPGQIYTSAGCVSASGSFTESGQPGGVPWALVAAAGAGLLGLVL